MRRMRDRSNRWLSSRIGKPAIFTSNNVKAKVCGRRTPQRGPYSARQAPSNAVERRACAVLSKADLC
jgi:hypothetical protein